MNLDLEFTLKRSIQMVKEQQECELCGEARSDVDRCRCADCREVNGNDGRLLCYQCANGIYE